MNRKQRRSQERATLGIAADAISEEIRDKKWSHVADLHTKPIRDCTEVIAELARRCPGHDLEEYQDAISRSMFYNR
jgi:hypothetical protein